MKKFVLVNWLLLISGIICFLSGIVLDFHLFQGGREVKILLKTIHTWSGYIMAIACILHVKWHLLWFKKNKL